MSSDAHTPFLLIMVTFLLFNGFFGLLWYHLGEVNEALGNHHDVYGTESLNDAFYLSLQILTVGEYAEDIPEVVGFRAIYFAMIFCGLIVFAILIGFITDSVTDYMDELKEGMTHVFENNHTLILGWNESTARVVVQCSFLRRQYQMLNEKKWPILTYFGHGGSSLITKFLSYFGALERPSTSVANNDIVIMSNNKTKAEMHLILHQTLKERGISSRRTKIGQNIICRVGDPKNVNDLIRVGAHRASAILVQVIR